MSALMEGGGSRFNEALNDVFYESRRADDLETREMNCLVYNGDCKGSYTNVYL